MQMPPAKLFRHSAIKRAKICAIQGTRNGARNAPLKLCEFYRSTIGTGSIGEDVNRIWMKNVSPCLCNIYSFMQINDKAFRSHFRKHFLNNML